MAAEASDDRPDLSVIVPVHNAEGHLPDLVRAIFALERSGLRCQIIAIDDGSTDRSGEVLRDLAIHHTELLLIEGAINCGAGIARNEGWPHVTGRYSLFFDADDILHGEVVVEAIRDMDADLEMDVTMFAYRYEREVTANFTDMGYNDRKIFDRLLRGAPKVSGQIESMAHLLGFTNYPWNKLLRTAHFQQAGMRFGKTKVNNDILGHWHSLLLARKIMIRDAVVCTHIVHPAGNNITNSFGHDRLQMFDALEEAYDFLESRPDLRRRFAHHFWGLAKRLVGWARPRLDPAFILQFEQRYEKLVARIDLGDLTRMRTKYAPDVAAALVNQLIR